MKKSACSTSGHLKLLANQLCLQLCGVFATQLYIYSSCGGDSEVTHSVPEASVQDNIFKSSFRQVIIIAFFWGEKPQFPVPLGNGTVIFILLY